MKNLFDPDSKFMGFCQKFVQYFVMNLLWLLCCLPVFTAGSAAKAMYASLFAIRQEETWHAKDFFRAFRQDFGRTTVLWLLILLLGGALILDYFLVARMAFAGRMAVIGVIFFFLFALAFFNSMVFPMLSQFPCTLRESVINGVLLSLAHLPKILLVTAMNLLPWGLWLVVPKLFWMLGFFWFTCGFALIARYNLGILDKVFAPFQQEVSHG